MNRLTFTSSLLLALGSSCAATEDAVVARPYTTDQIRASNTPGTRLVFRLELPDRPVMHQYFEFGETDGEYVKLDGRVTDADGNQLGETQVSRPTWVELRNHATYSPTNTRRTDEVVTVKAGTFGCTLYTVRKDDGSIERFWFAKGRPGPPVLTTSEMGGENVFRMELLSVTKR